MKKIFLLAFTLMLGFSVSAQAAQADSQENTKPEYVYDGFWSNWFISAGGGIKFPFYADGLDVNNSAVFNISAGKWINPYVGIRGLVSYSRVTGDNAVLSNGFIAPNATEMKTNIATFSGNVMFNLTSAICGYDSSRIYQFIPYVGAGSSVSFANDTRRMEIVPVFGIYNDFRISRSFSLFLDASIEFARERYYGSAIEACRVLPTSLTIGATYYFGGEKAREFKTVAESHSYLALLGDYKNLEGENADLEAANKAAEAQVASLNEDLKDAKAETAAAKADAAAAKAAAAKAKAAVWPETLFFQIESSSVSRQDVARLRAVAEGMNNNPNAKYVVEGYSDSATGSADYNQKLSQKRADSVVKTLVDVYGVDADQLQAVGKGGVDHKFSSSIFNRYVSIKAL